MSELFTSAERAATDFDGWHASLPDGIKADVEFQLGLAPDREAEKRKIANSLWLASRTGLDLGTVADNYDTVKEGWAVNQGLPVEAYAGDEQFSSVVRARATEDAAERTMIFGSDTDDDAGQKSRAESLATNARRQALWHPTMPEDARPDSGAWQQVRRGSPGFKPERAGYYEGLFSDLQAKERARFAPVLPVMNEAWEMLSSVPKGDEVLPGDVWDVAKKIGALGEKEASLVLAGLRERGEMLPDGDRDAFFSRLGQTMTRALNDIASGTILELGTLIGAETLERAASVTKAVGATETGRSQEEQAAEMRRVVRVANRLTALRNEKIDPIEVDSFADKVGLGVGSSIPQLVAGVMSGSATILTSSIAQANEELSIGFEAAGMSGADSDKWATELSPFAGGLMWAAEYFTFGMARGPAAALQKKIIGKMATSAPVTRLAAGLAVETGEQFAQEVLQDSTPVMVAELANAVGAPVPDQDVLKRIAEAASPETFGVSIVFALGGGGMMPRVEQARALKSIGFSDEAVEAVIAAPDESARAAAFRAGILDASIENAVLPEQTAPEVSQAEESFENADSGIQSINRTRDGWTVTTADGNQTQVDSGAAAVVLRDTLGQTRSDAEAEAMVEIADYLVGIDPRTEIQPTGKRVEFIGSDVFETVGRGTPRLKPLDDATRQSLEAEIDILRRTEGGEETMRGLVDGSNVIDWKDAVGGEVERIINRINTSGDVMTQFHEFVEGRWKAGIAQGGITPQETLAAIRAYERATGRLALSEQATPDEVREAVSNLASAYVFARKKDGTHSPAGAVHKGMKAAIQSAISKDERKALGKFRAFLRTVRAFWRHVFQTAAAIRKAMRDGKLKEGDDFTGFMDKLLGVADQRAHEAAVAENVQNSIKKRKTKSEKEAETNKAFLEAQAAKAKRSIQARRGAGIPDHPLGVTDILNEILEHGKIYLPPARLRQDSHQDMVNVAKALPPRYMAIFSQKSGRRPDQMAQDIYDNRPGMLPDAYPASLAQAILDAYAGRIRARQQVQVQEKQLKQEAKQTAAFETEVLNPKPAVAENRTQVQGGELRVGDELTVDGHKIRVTDLDPDTGQLTLEDGAKFGIQRIMEEDVIYVENHDSSGPGAALAAWDFETDTGETFALSSTSGLERLARQTENRAAAMKPAEKAKLFQDISAELAGIARSRTLQDKVEGKPSARKEMLRSLVTLDAILAQLPAEVRVRIGGFVKLASLQTTPARLRFIEDRVKKIEVEAEKYFRKELTKAASTIFKQSKPRKGTVAGEKMLGKLGAEVHELIKAAQKATTLKAEEVAAEIARLESLVQSGTLTPEQEAMATMEQNLISLAGDWKNADAARMSAAVSALDDLYHDGLLRWAETVKKRTERREAIRESLRTDTGASGVRKGRVEMEAKRLGLPGQASDVFLSLSSFEEVLRYAFGDESQTAVELSDAERKAAYQYEDENQAVADGVADFFKTLTNGDTLAAENLRFDLSQRTIDGGDPWGKFSELEVIQGLLMWRQEDGQRHMEGNGITQAWIDGIAAKLSDAGRAAMAFISDQYAGEWQELNKLYVKRHGVNLPSHANYAPITVQPVQGQTAQTIDPVTGMPANGSVFTPGSLRTRSTTAIAEPRFADALQTLIAHKKQMAYWKAYYDLAVDMGQVFGNRELMNSVEAAGGAQLRSVIGKWSTAFAQGGNRDAAAGLAINDTLSRVLSRFARMALVGRVGTILIQSTQLGAAAAEMPAGAYIRRFGKLMAGQLGWKKSIQSAFIQRRIKQAPPIVRQALEGLSKERPNRIKHISNALGMGISWADGIFTAGTYAIIFDYQLQLAKDAGLTGAAAEATAHKAAERITERVAQPTRMGTRSLFENMATRPMEKMAFAFASEARQKMTLAVWALKHAKKDPARAARAAFVVWGVGGLMAAVIRNAWRDVKDDDDDEVFDEKIWGMKRLMLNTLSGPLQGVPIFGEAIEAAAGKAFGVWTPSGDAMSAVGRSVPAAKRLATLDFMENEEQMETAIKDAEAIMMAMGLFNENMAAATSIANLLADAGRITDNLVTTDKEAADLKAKADAKAIEQDRKEKREAAEAALTDDQKAAIQTRKEAEKIRTRARNAARAEALKATKQSAN